MIFHDRHVVAAGRFGAPLDFRLPVGARAPLHVAKVPAPAARSKAWRQTFERLRRGSATAVAGRRRQDLVSHRTL